MQVVRRSLFRSCAPRPHVVTIPRDFDRDLVLRHLNELESSKEAYWEAGNF